MAATVDLSGKGMLCVMSRISRNDILDEATFLKWYDDEHIAEIMRTSGVSSARRFVDVNASAEKPYLAMYAMDDIAFVKSDEFRGIHFKSGSLPGSGIIYDLADLDVRNDRLVQVYDPTSKGKGHTRSLVLNQVELGDGISDQEFDKCFRQEHLPSLASSRGYLRTTSFKLAFARSNAESRVLKGLAPPTDEPPPKAATWLTLHEFECGAADIDLEELKTSTSSSLGEKIKADALINDHKVYRLEKEFGHKDWFHEIEL